MAGRGSGTVTVKFLADAGGFKKDTEEASNALSGFGKVSEGLQSSLGKFGQAMAGLGIGAFLKDATQGAAEDAAAQAKLATAVRNSIGATEDDIKSIEAWIGKAQLQKGFADGDLRDAFGSLIGVTHNVSEAQDLMGTAMDLSRAKSIPLAQAADILAKAHEGNGKAVKALLPDMGQLIADNASAQDIINAVAGATKGQADAFADSAAGGAAKLHEQMGELQETIGAFLLPVLEKLTTALSGVFDWFSKLSPGVQTAIGVFAGAVAGLVLLNSILTTATAAAAAFGVTLNLSLGPIALVFGAVAGLAAGIYLLVTHWDTVKEKLGAGLKIVAGWFSDLGTKIANLAGAIWEPLWGGLKGVLNRAVDLLNTFIDGSLAPITLLNKIPGVKSVVPDIPHIPHLAGGGPFQGAALVGEAGPELIVGSGRVVPNDQLGGVTFNAYFYGPQDPAGVSRQLEAMLTNFKRQGGQLRFLS